MKNIFGGLFLLLSVSSFSEVPLSGLNSEQVFFETVDSAGKLDFSVSQNKEIIEFGKNQNSFAMGLIFDSKNLPSTFLKNFKGSSLIQISLGNRVPQINQMVRFGSLTIKSKNVYPQNKLELSFLNLTKKEQLQSAFLILNSPQRNTSATEADKLKTTFFSEQGKLKLIPKGSHKIVYFKIDGKSLKFKKQLMNLVLDVQVGSPFSDEKGEIKGAIDLPIFSPAENKANSWIKKIAQEKLEVFPEISPTPPPKRVLASPRKGE